MILSYAKSFDEKMRKQVVKNMEKILKKHVGKFLSLSIDDMKAKQKNKSASLV